jgi:hypothetical protein
LRLLAVEAYVIDAGVVGDSVSFEPLTPSVVRVSAFQLS